MKKKIPLFFFPLGALLFIAMSFTFFQQDEWHSFGVIQSYGGRYITLDKNPLYLLFSDRIGARVITYILFSLFGTSSIPFAFVSAALHALNSYLVYFLVWKIGKNKTIAFISSLLFFFNSLGHQAYSWFGTMAGTATATTFVFLSVIFYIAFLEKKNTKNLVVSLLFLFASFLFKESGFFVFLLAPLTWFLYERKIDVREFFIKNWPIVIYGLFMTVILVRSILFIPGARTNYISSDSSGSLKVVSHLVSYPFESIGQSFIPFQFIFEAARKLTEIFVPSLTPETPDFDLFYTTKMTEAVVIAMSLIFIALFIFVYKKFLERDKALSRLFIFSFAFLVLSFLPYVVLDKFDAYLDSCYYYLGLFGSSSVFGILAVSLFRSIKSYSLQKLFVSIMTLIFLSHVFFLSSDLLSLARAGIERRSIISQIETIMPTLSKKIVFYVTGDSPGYYGIPELKVPFQSGFGQILLTSYGVKDPPLAKLFKEDTLSHALDAGFLYDTVAQGYKEENGRAFGYYYDKSLLDKEISLGKFTKSDIASFYYDSNSM